MSTQKEVRRRRDMPRGKVSVKVDELFTRWINLPETEDKESGFEFTVVFFNLNQDRLAKIVISQE